MGKFVRYNFSILSIFLLLAPSISFCQTTIFSDDFESGELSWWIVGDTNAIYGEDYWNIVEGTSHGKSAWCAAIPGTSSDEDLTNGKCWHHYANMMDAFMKRIISLSDYENCRLIFDYHLSCEQDNDYFLVKINGIEKIKRSGFVNWDRGDEGDEVVIDLSNYDGKIISIEFIFHSDLVDCIYPEAGAFVDDVRIVGDPKGDQTDWIEMENAWVIQFPSYFNEEWIYNAFTSQALNLSISVVIGLVVGGPIGTICGVIYSLITSIPSVNTPFFDVIIAQDGESKNRLEVGHKFVPICFTFVGGATSEEGIATQIKIYKWNWWYWNEIDSRQILTFDEAFWMDEHTLNCWQIVPKFPMVFNELGNYSLVWGNGQFWDGDEEAFVFPDTTNPFVSNWESDNTPETDIRIFFSEYIDETSFNNSTIIVSGSSSGIHSCDFSFNNILYELIINPDLNFAHGETVYVTVNKEIRDLADNMLLEPYTFNFFIEGQEIPKIIIDKIEMDKPAYNPGDSATISVSLQDNSGNPLEGAAVSYNIKDSNSVIVKTDSCSDNGNGNYESTFSVNELGNTGTFSLEITASKVNYQSATGAITFDVVNPAIGHNLKLDLFTTNRTNYEPGSTASFELDISNIGDFSEDVTATLVITGPDNYLETIEDYQGTVEPGYGTGTFSMSWDIPSDAAHGSYAVEAKATSPSGDEDFTDNKKSIVIGVYEFDGEIQNSAFQYVTKYLFWDPDYQIPGCDNLGGRYATWEDAPNGNQYKIEIGAYSEDNDGTRTLAMNVYKNGSALSVCYQNDWPSCWVRTNYGSYYDGVDFLVFNYDEFQEPNGNTVSILSMAVPVSDSNIKLEPIENSVKLGSTIDFQVNLPDQIYDSLEVWRCNPNDQPNPLNNGVLNYFDCPALPDIPFSITATPTSIDDGTNFALIADGDSSNYILFGKLLVEHSYDAEVSNITIEPTSPRSGTTVTITSTIENKGSALLTAIEVITSVTGPDEYNKTFNSTTDGGNVEFSWDTLGCSAGDYSITTTISHSNDTNETNNTLNETVYVGPPLYLVVTANTDNASYCVNEIVNVSIEVKDDSGFFITGANVTYAVLKNGSLILSSNAVDQGNGTYLASFNAPNIPDNYKINVQADYPRYVPGQEEIDLLVKDCTSPSITLLSPNGGETLLSGNTYNIIWDASDNIGVTHVQIEYSIDNGVIYSLIVESTPNTGSFPWTVPNTASNICLVRVSAFDIAENSNSDESNNVFSIILSGQLQVFLSPQDAINAGAQWKLSNESTWHDNGETISYIPRDYVLEFKEIADWTEPEDKDVTIIAGELIDETGAYQRHISLNERNALIALYNSTNGDNWIDNSGWKDGPLEPDGFGPIGTEDNWYGVEVSNGHVTRLHLSNNNLNGTITPVLANFFYLEVLDMSGNQLTGSIPSSLGFFEHLMSLYLQSNQLTGNIPPELGSIPSLDFFFLNLSSNQLVGSLPEELGNLTSLWVLDLSSNQLSGSIPDSIRNLTYLYHLDFSSNQLSGDFPSWIGELRDLMHLNLSLNHLTGSIPPGIGNPGPRLGYLNLSSNRLSGSIPEEIGHLDDLGFLDFSSNMLSGDIPYYITDLFPCTTLNLRYNALYCTNDEVRNFINNRDPDWEDTQTVAPTNVAAESAFSNTVRVSWNPIAYSADPGCYVIFYSTTSGGPWTEGGRTDSKADSEYTVTDLSTSTLYYFVVQTQTDSHTNNQNTVASENSDEAEATTHDICIAPTITQHPQSQTIDYNTAASLIVAASGTLPFDYQWYQGESGDTSMPVGPNSNEYTTPVLTDTAQYWVRVSNACGQADSDTATIIVIPLAFVTDVDSVKVPEDDTNTFQVRLSAQPTSEVGVTVSKVSGDADITIKSGANLIFNDTDWATFKIVTLEAAQDGDAENGEAIFRISAANIVDKDITATEDDDEFNNGEIILSLDLFEGTQGNILDLPIQISNNKHELSAYSLEFNFDSDLFDLREINPGSLTSDWNILETNEISPGKIEINGIAGGGTLVPSLSSGTILAISLDIKCVDYTNQLDCQFSIENFSNDLIGYSPDPCSTNLLFKPCQDLGDVNGDGMITPGDAQKAFDIYLERLSPDFCQKTMSDANCNESTTPADAQYIFETYLGRKTLPKCCADYLEPTTSLSLADMKYKPQKENIPQIIYPLNTIADTKEIIEIPVIASNAQGIGNFSFELNFDFDALEYLGVKKGTLTKEFDTVEGEEESKGIISIKGEDSSRIETDDTGSLVVAVFKIKEGITGRIPIWILNTKKDLSSYKASEGIIVKEDYFRDNSKYLNFGEPRLKSNGVVCVPLEITEAFNIKSFGLEVKFSSQAMSFIGVNRTDLSKDFVAFDANVMDEGMVKIGGFGLSGIQTNGPGVLLELLFSVNRRGGKLEIINLVDDLKNFTLPKNTTSVKNREIN